MIGRYFIGARRATSSVYVTDDAGHVLALCEDRDYAQKIVTALNAYEGAVEALYQVAEQAGRIECDYDLIARLLDEHGDGRTR